MVETRRGSSSKRPLSSPSPSNAKRSKVSEDDSSNPLPSIPVKESATGNESGEPEIRRSDLPETASLKILDGDNKKPPSVPIETDPLVSPQCPGETGEKAKAVQPLVSCRKKRTVARPIHKSAPWGKLISQSSQNPHLSISEPIFTVGQGRQSNLTLKDPTIGNVLCKLSHIEQHGGASVALLEITGGKGVVQVNGKTYRRNARLILNGGDEVIFGALGKHAYVSST